MGRAFFFFSYPTRTCVKTIECCTTLMPVGSKMSNSLEAKPGMLLARLGPVLCHASEPGKQAGQVQLHSWGLTIASGLQPVPPCPDKVTTPNAVQYSAPPSPSCSCHRLCPSCSHHTGPLHFPALPPSSPLWTGVPLSIP